LNLINILYNFLVFYIGYLLLFLYRKTSGGYNVEYAVDVMTIILFYVLVVIVVNIEIEKAFFI